MSAPAPAAQQPAAPRTPEQDRAAWRALIWTAAPVIATLALRASLQGHAGEAMQGPHGALQPLREAAQAASAGQALWLASRPFILSAAALLALWLAGRQALRRCGWQRLRLAALALWLLLWLAAAAWLVASHLTRTGRSAQPAQTAQVLLVREIAPTSRGPGGAEVYGQTGPGAPALRVRAEGRAMSDFPQNSAVTLRPWRGRWWGRWATVERAGEN